MPPEVDYGLFLAYALPQSCPTFAIRGTVIILFCNDRQETRFYIPAAALSMGDGRIKINRVARIQDKFPVSQSNNDGTFQNKVEFLTFVSDQLGNGCMILFA